MTKKNHGFTLLEMAIVLAIIGLIMGSIIIGKSVKRSAQIQSVYTDLDRYRKAMQMFKDKYSYLPGDLPTAVSFWNNGVADTGCPNATPANHSPKFATCNGNGDGFIGDITGTPQGTTTAWYETYRAWQHLANAGIIDGEYTGALSDRVILNTDPGMSIPVSKVAGAGVTVLYARPTVGAVGAAGYFPGNYGHILVLGAPAGNIASTYNAVLTTTESEGIDTKIDDGIPGTGNVMTFPIEVLPKCTTGGAWNLPSATTYNTAVLGNQCSLIFITGF